MEIYIIIQACCGNKKTKGAEKVDEYEREDMLRDVQIDAQYKTYDVTVTVSFTKRIHARNSEEAENELYDEVDYTLKGSHLDYDFDGADSDEVDEN